MVRHHSRRDGRAFSSLAAIGSGLPGEVKNRIECPLPTIILHRDMQEELTETTKSHSGATPESVRVSAPVSLVLRLYHKHQKYLPVVTFATGFTWDSLTLNRIDSLLDNFILMGYLIALAAMIITTLRRQAGLLNVRWICRIEGHFPWAMQFIFGGLFSSYVVFYSKSASWTQTKFFIILLVILLVGNEFLHHRLENPLLLSALYSFCLFSFLAFFLPVIMTRVDPHIFLLAGILSLAGSLIVFGLALSPFRADLRKHILPAFSHILAVHLCLIFLYFLHLIPPVPLALKQAGIYHYVAKAGAGYEVRYVLPPWYRFWDKSDDPFYYVSGESVYCYTAIFAPRRIHIPVRHVWRQWNETAGWVETDKISFEISGGREGGYRGFSRKKTVAPGRWRVEVETNKGQILGRIDFTVTPSPIPHPQLTTHAIS